LDVERFQDGGRPVAQSADRGPDDGGAENRADVHEGEDGIDKLFKKHTARLRYGQGALLYSLYAWILVQKKDADGAHKVLIKACEKMENETVKKNRELLANNKVGQFSNAGLGDEWYALHLEEPKVRVQRQSRFSSRPF
jgi:hypothetical protein